MDVKAHAGRARKTLYAFLSCCLGIASSWRDTGNLGLKILATLTPRFVDTDLGDNPTAAIKHGNVANRARGRVFAFGLKATLWTGVILGRDDQMLDIIILSADQLGESHEGSS